MKQINSKNFNFFWVLEKLFLINGNAIERIKSTGKLPINATISATIKKHAVVKSPFNRNHSNQPSPNVSEDKNQILAAIDNDEYSFFILKVLWNSKYWYKKII